MRRLSKLINIKVKLVFIYSVTILVMISIIGVSVYSYCGNMLSEKIRTETKEKVRNACSTVATVERCIDRACQYIAESKSFGDMMRFKSDNAILVLENQEKVNDELKNIFGTFFDMQSISPYVHRMKFYINKDLDFVKSGYVNDTDDSGSFGVISTAAVENEEWFKKASVGKQIHIYAENAGDAENNYIYLAKNIVDAEGTLYGYCNIGLNINNILGITPNMYAAVLDSGYDIIYNSMDSVGVNRLDELVFTMSELKSDEMLIYKNPDDGEKYYIDIETQDIGIKIITAVSAREEMYQLKGLTAVTLILLMFLLVLGIMTFGIISNKITSPLMKLADFVERGDVEAKIPPIPKFNMNDEIGIVYKAVDRLTEKVKQTRENDRNNFAKEKQMEIKMRQIQIGPHFLNNALNTLSCKAMIDGNDDIADYAAELANILEYGLKNPEEPVELKTEVECLRKYIYLQNYAYEGAISLKTEIPSDLKNVKVIKMILQPLAENSILHGYDPDADNIEIAIKAEEDGDMFILSVSDNGMGCDAEELNRALKDGTIKGLGVKNVYERLNICFGEGYGLHYRNDECGLTAILKMKKIDVWQ